MKVKITHPYDKTQNRTLDLQQAVEVAVDGSDYERGELETMYSTIHNQTLLIAKLIEYIKPDNETLTQMLADYGEKVEVVE